MRMNYIFDCVSELIEKYNTRDPFELMKQLGIILFSSNLDSSKGYCIIVNGYKYIAINNSLEPRERTIVAAHELGHIILHADQLNEQVHRDFNCYNVTDKTEYQANLFAADLLIDDSEVEELLRSEGMDLYTIAKCLYTDPQLLTFKLISMAKRGYNCNIILPPKSNFLAY